MGNRNMNALENNNMLNINNEEQEQNLIPVEEQNQIIKERATTKKILAVRLPVYLKKQTLSLQQDAVSQDKWFIKFNYDSLVNLDCYINLNVSQNPNHKHEKKLHSLSYFPSLNLENKGIVIKNLPSGENVEFFNKDAFIDINNYFNLKIDGPKYYDLCIEFVPIFPPGSPELADGNEIIFVTLCNFEKHNILNNSYDIKCNLQRLRTHEIWIDFHDIFDSSLEGGLCLICCSVVRNTIFLPCKHAACCEQCGSEIKLRFKPCPICKTPIDDLLIIDSDEKSNEDNLIGENENTEKKDDNPIKDNNKNEDNNNIILRVNENIKNNLITNINDNNINNNLISNNENNDENDNYNLFIENHN